MHIDSCMSVNLMINGNQKNALGSIFLKRIFFPAKKSNLISAIIRIIPSNNFNKIYVSNP